MLIKSIKVSNFKSFKKLDIELRDFNLIIGPNASGKSNFIQVFRFLQDITEHGLNNAISNQGRMKYLRNLNIEESAPTTIKVSFKQLIPFRIGPEYAFEIDESAYSFSIHQAFDKTEVSVKKDKLIHKGYFCRIERGKNNTEQLKHLCPGKILISHKGKKLDIKIEPKELDINKPSLTPYFLRDFELKPSSLLLELNFLSSTSLASAFRAITFLDINPKSSKSATPLAGRADLEEDARNLALLLRDIVSDNENKRKLLNLVTDILPFIKDVGVEKFVDKSIFFNIQEKYFGKQQLPASLISDGTINLMALIAGLYFEKKPLMIIEGPEREIHPHLISHVVDMMEDASRQKQIIATTHNPELLKHADLKDVFVIRRDENGFSQITQPADDKKVKTFLKHELGLEDLFVQDMLGT